MTASLWFVAFLCALYPFNAFDLEFFAGCVILLFTWSYVTFAKDMEGGWNVPKSSVLAFAGLFFLLTIASIFWSEVKPVTLLTICQFAAMPVTFLTLAIRPDAKLFRLIGYAMVPLFLGLGVWAILQYYFLHDYFEGQARHPLQDPSSLGALLSLALFCAIGWVLSAAPRAHKILGFALVCALIGGIYATAARGPVFALLPGIALMAVLLWPRLKESPKITFAMIAAFVLVPLLMQMTGGPTESMSARIGETLSGDMRGGDVSNRRIYLWLSTWDVIKHYPLLGTGFGTYFQYLPEFMDSRYVATAFHAHSDPLEFWAELGILGPVLFYGFVIAASVRTFSALKNLGAERVQERILIVSVFCALLSMVVHTHVTFNLYNLSILMLTGFLLAVWFYATGKVLLDKTRLMTMGSAPHMLSLIALCLPYLMLGGLFFINVAGEHYANKARDNLFNHEMMEFADNINKSGRISQDMNYRSYLLAVNVPLTLLEVNKSTMDADGRRKLYDQAAGYMNRVLELNPRSDSALYYLAKAQELAGADAVPDNVPTREDLYTEALRLNPLHLGARLSLYTIYRAEKRTKEDLYNIMEPVANKMFNTPVAVEYFKQLAGLYAEHGDYIKSKDAMAKLMEFQRRYAVSAKMQSMSVPEALMRFDPSDKPINPFPQGLAPDSETSGKTKEGL